MNVSKEKFKEWLDNFGPSRSYTCACGLKTNKLGNGKRSCGKDLEIKVSEVYELKLSNILWFQSGKELIKRDGVRIFKG